MVLVITSAILAIIFGLIILIFPKVLNIAVGLYLLISGILGLFGNYLPWQL